MASKRVNKLAGELATKMLAEGGVAKSAGSMASVMPYAVGLAESVVMVEKALKRTVRQMEQHADHVGRLVDENAVRINRLAESYHAAMGPSVPAARGYRDLDPERFRVGLVDQQSAPRTMNGHGPEPEDGPAPFPPQWHPESSD